MIGYLINIYILLESKKLNLEKLIYSKFAKIQIIKSLPSFTIMAEARFAIAALE